LSHSVGNPDEVERLSTGGPLAEIDWDTVYAAGRRGYVDYPALQRATA
jgi:N-ethylmaleimide reductase